MKFQFYSKIISAFFLVFLAGNFSSLNAQTSNCGYPDNSNLPRSAVIFNESEVLRAFSPVAGGNSSLCGAQSIKMWYNDEHAMTLGVRSVSIKTATGTTTTNYPITATPTTPGCVDHPLVGSTIQSGAQAGVDVAAGGGRPMFPALFITNVTNDPFSRSGTWQQGGLGIPPHKVCGTWKGATKFIDSTRNPVTISITPDADPVKNHWTGVPDTPPGGFASLDDEGYGAEVVWNIDELNLAPGTYLFQFMVHDGDQNKAGGDCGESCVTVVISGLNLGNNVWNDINNNGQKEIGEAGINGATVKLYIDANNDNIADGAAVATTTTDVNGVYNFTNLVPNNYIVGVTIPAGFSPVITNGGDPDNDTDNDNNGTNTSVAGEVRSNALTLSCGQEPTTDGDGNNGNLTVDFALSTIVNNGSIGDFVWNDINKNGLQDDGEVGVSGVTISLYDASNTLLATTVTDAYGKYLFSNLQAATGGTNYQVRFSLPPQYVFSPQSQGANGAVDSDPSALTGRTSNVTLTSAAKDRTDIDAGIYYATSAKIGDFIWNDLNQNGFQDAGEPGIAGVTVTLYNSLGAVIRSTITDNKGFYQFTDLVSGSYTLGLTQPVGYILSPADIVSDDAKDSDFDPLTFKTASFTVVAGTANLTFDGGLHVTTTTVAAVGDKVWNDLNNNGLQDNNEPGVPGVLVQLYTSAGVLVATQTTDVFGIYMFNNVTPGISYFVKFSGYPAGYVLVAANVGGSANYQIDSDVSGANGIGTTASFPLTNDETRVTVDAGLRNPNLSGNSALGDFVWYDMNKNGIQDAGEAGVPGVTAVLYDAASGAVLKTTTSNANGYYMFTDLAIGSYILGFTNLPDGFLFSSKDQSIDDAIDNDVDASNGRTGTYTISSNGTIDRTVDAGLKPEPNVRNSKGSIGDRVWNDINSNGIQDAGEPGVVGVTVTLYAGDGTTVIATTTTDGFGNYIFTKLDAGNYVVGFSGLPSGYVFGVPNAGTDREKDSDPNTVTGKTPVILLASGEVNLSIDAGVKATTPKSALGDLVWYDFNNNGIQDAGEPGAAGISISLYNSGGAVVKTASTDAKGNYLFTDLDAGTYTLGFMNLPAGYVPTIQNAAGSTAANNSDVNPATNKTSSITVVANTTDITWDMGIVSTSKAAVGDYVWNDVNGNGIQDLTEKPIAGITVTLYNNNGLAITSAVTDGNGFYMFSNLNPGTYVIGFSNIPINSSFTTKNAAGSIASNNSDVNGITGKTDEFTLIGGEVRNDIDAGLVSLFANVGDFVWYDVNINGRQDAGEAGVPGVTVKLYDAGSIVIATAVTDGNGRYFINNIPVNPGGSSFTVGVSDLPSSTQGFTIKNAPGTTTETNSDINPGSGRTDAFVLFPGQTRLDIDGGLILNTNGCIPGSPGCVLPVTIINLKGIYENGKGKLTWTSVTEINANYYEVQRSQDGASFVSLGRVNAKGNSSVAIDYAYFDNLIASGFNYYRLKMVDKNGTFTFTNIVLITVNIKGITITGIYPNPFSSKVNISVSTEKAEELSVRIFDNIGKLVYAQQKLIPKGTSLFVIDELKTLASGVYMIEVKAGDILVSQKLIKEGNF